MKWANDPHNLDKMDPIVSRAPPTEEKEKKNAKKRPKTVEDTTEVGDLAD